LRAERGRLRSWVQRRAQVLDMRVAIRRGAYLNSWRDWGTKEKKVELTRHSRQAYSEDIARMSCLLLWQSHWRMRPGWAWRRKQRRSAGASVVGLTRPSVPGTDRRDIDGHPGGCDPCRIACHNDIGSVGGRALCKKGANSARRWEASPFPGSDRETAGQVIMRAAAQPSVGGFCVCVLCISLFHQTTMNIVVRCPIYLCAFVTCHNRS